MSKEAMKLALEALEDLGMKHFESTGEVLHKEVFDVLKEALAKQEGQSNFCPNCEALARELKAVKQEQGEPDDLMIAYMSGLHDGKKLAKKEQGEPVAIIHRNEYNEYRLEPHDSFDIKSIPFNVDVLLFKGKNNA